MPNWVAIQKKEKSRADAGECWLGTLDSAVSNKKFIKTAKKESVSDFLARGGKIKHLKSK